MTTRLLNIEQTSEMVGQRSKKTIMRDVADGSFPAPVRVGGRLYWREDAICKFIDGLSEVPAQ